MYVCVGGAMAFGREEVVKGAAVTVVAFWLLRKLAKDIGREAERLGQRTRADVESGKAIEAMRAESDLLLLKARDSMQASLQHLAASSRLHCKLQGANLFCEIEPKDLPYDNEHLAASSRLHCKLKGDSLFCEIEPKDLPYNNVGSSQSSSHKDCSKKT